jgi:hypothetical protein
MSSAGSNVIDNELEILGNVCKWYDGGDLAALFPFGFRLSTAGLSHYSLRITLENHTIAKGRSH